MLKCHFAGLSDIGFHRNENEDYISVVSLDDNNTFSILADGTHSIKNFPQPAHIVINEIVQSVQRAFSKDKNAFISNAEIFIEEAFHSANNTLMALKIADEERLSGFAASVSCCFISENNDITYVHSGNTRIYRIRKMKNNSVNLKQLTSDHTKAQNLVDKGLITEEDYHIHPDRLIINGGLGVHPTPKIQSMTTTIKAGDIIFLTTDGIHYAIKPEPMMSLILESNNCDDAAQTLITTAKFLEYQDNMSVIVIYVTEKENLPIK